MNFFPFSVIQSFWKPGCILYETGILKNRRKKAPEHVSKFNAHFNDGLPPYSIYDSSSNEAETALVFKLDRNRVVKGKVYYVVLDHGGPRNFNKNQQNTT